MRVLIIPEDQELDRYIVKPIVEALFADLERSATVDVLPEPRLRGADDALDPTLVASVIDDNPMTDLFVLVVDGDCNRFNNETRALARQETHAGRLLTCVAREEVEVWLLALYSSELQVSFAEVRAECDPKERYAEPLLARLGNAGPGHGRKRAMRALRGKWRSLRDRCEELRSLQDAVSAWLTQRT